jgi:hypothetical protein
MKTNIKSKNKADKNLSYLRLIQPENDKSKFFYPLAHQSWDDTEHKAIINQLYSGRLTMGENVAKFEKQFANYPLQIF